MQKLVPREGSFPSAAGKLPLHRRHAERAEPAFPHASSTPFSQSEPSLPRQPPGRTRRLSDNLSGWLHFPALSTGSVTPRQKFPCWSGSVAWLQGTEGGCSQNQPALPQHGLLGNTARWRNCQGFTSLEPSSTTTRTLAPTQDGPRLVDRLLQHLLRGRSVNSKRGRQHRESLTPSLCLRSWCVKTSGESQVSQS